MAAEFDNLFELRNNFYVGAFSQALEEGKCVDSSESHDMHLRDAFVYRIYLAQGKYQILLDEISSSSPPDFLALRLYATHQVQKEGTAAVLSTMQEWEKKPEFHHGVVPVMCASILVQMGSLEDALKWLGRETEPSLENRALRVQIYLRINRVDVADREVDRMMAADEDSVISQLAFAWVNLHKGDGRIRDVQQIFLELIEKYSPTCMLRNGLAVAKMQLKEYSEAERILVETYNQNPQDAETLVNLIIVMQLLHKPIDAYSRSLSALRSVSPSHPWLTQYDDSARLFDEHAAQYSPSVV